MIKQKVFPINTRAVVNGVTIRLMTSGLSNNMQEIGCFVDKAATALSEASARYCLARFTREKSATLAEVYNRVTSITYNSLGGCVPNLTQDQLEQARFIIYSELSKCYTGALAGEEGKWQLCTLVHTTQFDFTINATRQDDTPAANSPGMFYQGSAA